jgi:hypothetical protein
MVSSVPLSLTIISGHTPLGRHDGVELAGDTRT